MGEKLKNLIRGARTILEIMPATQHKKVGDGIVSDSEVDSLRGDWEKVGGHLREAARQLASHGKQKQT